MNLIYTRAKTLGLVVDSKISHMMDISSAIELFDIDLDAWLEADDFNFAHDFVGIYNSIKRNEHDKEKMFGYFVPRFARK